MANVWGGIERFLGGIISGVYGVIPQYGVSIILLTVIVRLVLFPLAVKQIRSMSAMQRVQPKLKELQKKHKGDRPKLNEEMMKLYKEHGVNPLGGCFPMVLQMPAFIALYAVIRSAILIDVPITPAQKIIIPVTRDTICRPAALADPSTVASIDPASGTQIACETGSKTQTFTMAGGTKISRVHSATTYSQIPSYATRCTLPKGLKTGDSFPATLRCTSPLGTGHLGEQTKLFTALAQDKATFLGMHLSCSPVQALSKTSIRQCTSKKNSGGGGPIVGVYFALVILMAGTTWYQQKQMMARQAASGSPQASQMQMMGKIMPVFMGYLSLNFPAALSVYWIVGNLWMIGQQHFILKAQGGLDDGGKPAVASRPGKPKPQAPANRSSGRPGKRPQKGRPNKSRR